MARSINGGLTWIGITSESLNVVYTGIAYGNGTFIAVGTSAMMSRSIDGGVTWTVIPRGEGGNTFTSNIHEITYGDGTFIAVGIDGRMARSADNGLTWTAISRVESTFYDGTSSIQIENIAYGNGTFIAVGRDGRMARSIDRGVTWIAIPAGDGGSTFPTEGHWMARSINDIVYSNGIWIAVGGTAIGGGGTKGIARSTDGGATWVAISHGNGSFQGITHGSGTFIAVGGSTVYSTDAGLTWTTIPPIDGIHHVSIHYAIAYGNGTFIAVNGSNGTMARYTVNP